jgi:hypothetical protein
MEVCFVRPPRGILSVEVFESTDPAPLMGAVSANHMRASTVLLKGGLALRALVHIEILRIGILIQLIILILQASFPFMVQLLALHANVFHTTGARLYLIVYIHVKNLVTVWSRAEKQIFRVSNKVVVLESFEFLEAVLR